MPSGRDVVSNAFGAENRSRLIDGYLAGVDDLSAETAWKHVYRMLLWIDRTTGLAHCYESDKSQPGRPWYARSLRFHDWLSAELAVKPADLAGQLDVLFRHVIDGLSSTLAEHRADLAASQRAPYAGRGFPEPGEDPELEALILDVLGDYMPTSPSHEVISSLVQRVREYLAQENKRKNLLGEGFEDVLAAVISRVADPDNRILRRPLLHDVGGFHVPRGREKGKRVDLAVVDPAGQRMLLSAKWSVRADREEQFLTDFAEYTRLESSGSSFRYDWFTNEFDPARLVAACDRIVTNSPMFNSVVHIAPDGLLAAYGSSPTRSMARIPDLIESGRIISLAAWLRRLAA